MIEATEILPGLWQGSRPEEGPEIGRRFDMLVLCERQFQPPASKFPDVEIVRAHLNDTKNPTFDEQSQAIGAAKIVSKTRLRGHDILICCKEGRNRSGLVMGFAIYRLTALPGLKIVSYIQRKRPGALTNPTFIEILEKLK